MNDEIIKKELSEITEELSYSSEELSNFSADMDNFLSETQKVLDDITKDDIDKFDRFNLVFNEFYAKFNTIDSKLEQFKVGIDELNKKINSAE